jgi:hypothetical protein
MDIYLTSHDLLLYQYLVLPCSVKRLKGLRPAIEAIAAVEEGHNEKFGDALVPSNSFAILRNHLSVVFYSTPYIGPSLGGLYF